jgi:hypothetical protein
MECTYCKAILQTAYSLKQHQKTAKYCLSKQNKDILHEHLCGACGKGFTRKSSLDDHLKICKANIPSVNQLQQILDEKNRDIFALKKELDIAHQTIEELRKENSEYRKEMFLLASKPTHNTINNNIETWETIVEIEQETDTPEEPTDEPYELVPLELDNGYIIESREEDGYINITNLCKAGGKEFKHWNSLDKTKQFLKSLSTAVGIPTAVLIHLGSGSKFGTTEETTGTWVHPQVAINIAQWISPQFDVKVSAWVLEVMMSGKVDITNTKSYRELKEDNKNKQLKIQLMTKKYVKKQPRVQYEEKNVLYILTTANMKKERRYILGKATNLTSRLSVYNKSDEHEVVYYQECPDEEIMSIVESLVFCKLKEYREQANRERFLLPEVEKVDLFINTIEECINFVKEGRSITTNESKFCSLHTNMMFD